MNKPMIYLGKEYASINALRWNNKSQSKQCTTV